MAEFNPKRLVLARQRRGFTQSKLAELSGITRRSIGSYERGDSEPRDDEYLGKLSTSLSYPPAYFFRDDPPVPSKESVSFRSMSKMSATEREKALATGAEAIELHGWLARNFTTPAPNVPDLRHIAPGDAASAVRELWRLGMRPTPNLTHLLEFHGVRIFSLSGLGRNVDAFSFWYDEVPIILLNTVKSAEHARFDLAHELGHLVLHRHGSPRGVHLEREANTFAAALLMPESDVLATINRNAGLQELLAKKHRWGVSLIALVHRVSAIGLLSEWASRNLYISISRRGFRTQEPNPIPHERSQVLEKVVAHLRGKGGAQRVANETGVPRQNIESLLFGLATIAIQGASRPPLATPRSSPMLRIV